MKIIKLSKDTLINENLTSTIGIFDGLHKAHVQLIKKCINLAKKTNTKSSIITFNVLTNIKNCTTNIPLLREADQIKIIESLGVDYLLTIDLDEEFKQTAHEDFIKYLINLGVKNLVIGFDFQYGKDRLGSIKTIKDDAQSNINLTIIKEKTYHHQKIGTTEIKEYLKNGQIKTANKLLGYPYFITLDTNISSNQLKLIKPGIYDVIIDGFKTNIEVQDNTIELNDMVKTIDHETTITFLKSRVTK